MDAMVARQFWMKRRGEQVPLAYGDRMVVRLGEVSGRGLVDPRDVLAPVIEVALAARREVRVAKRYDLSDLIRDGLADAGIEVRDTPEGQVWELRPAE